MDSVLLTTLKGRRVEESGDECVPRVVGAAAWCAGVGRSSLGRTLPGTATGDVRDVARGGCIVKMGGELCVYGCGRKIWC